MENNKFHENCNMYAYNLYIHALLKEIKKKKKINIIKKKKINRLPQKKKINK